jgi:tryptophan 7-halogenase
MLKKLEIIIVGGGTAGWMCAAALASLVGEKVCKITLVESDEISSVGVGEATLPHMKDFNDRIGVDEADMMSQTQATIKLGIQFVDWGCLGRSYVHPFGAHGEPIGGVEFHQQWARVRHLDGVKNIDSYSFAIQSALHNKFQFPDKDPKKIHSTFSYAYHFDAGLYAAYLRKFSEQKNVKRIEGKIVNVINHSDHGAIDSIVLASGERIHGDYFIDCSGFQSLLLNKNLHSTFEDWSQWLVCDKAFAVASEASGDLPPYTQSKAKVAGWQWKIPLQQRTGNGYVFSSQHIGDDEAVNSLLSDIEGKAISEPKLLTFKAGRYQKSWVKNCIGIGLASGFLEPLESTSIYLVQAAILNFIKLFPEPNPEAALRNEYNRLMDIEYERIRDFLILHYHLNQRDDSDLWRYCRAMNIPDSLQEKITLFKHRGYVDSYKYGLFSLPSWISVLTGQNLIQNGFDPFASKVSTAAVCQKLSGLSVDIAKALGDTPAHKAFVATYCPAKH